MSRYLRRREDGKPLPGPAPLADWTEEPTVRTRMPTNEELEAELALHAEAGQGNTPAIYRKGPL